MAAGAEHGSGVLRLGGANPGHVDGDNVSEQHDGDAVTVVAVVEDGERNVSGLLNLRATSAIWAGPSCAPAGGNPPAGPNANREDLFAKALSGFK